jgi:hypothetical protein
MDSLISQLIKNDTNCAMRIAKAEIIFIHYVNKGDDASIQKLINLLCFS